MSKLENPSSSKNLLRKFVGKKITGLVRYSWWPKEQVALEINVDAEQSFSLTAGPLVILFEGDSELGVFSDPGFNTITVWEERFLGKSCVDRPLCHDAKLFPINAHELAYAGDKWNKFYGQVLSHFSIIKSKDLNVKQEQLPSEEGLCFHLENGSFFIASHGLHDGSDDFSVIFDDQISPRIRMDLYELPLVLN